jgi:hypothetical protein
MSKVTLIIAQIFVAFLFMLSVGGAIYLAGFQNTLPFWVRLFLAAAFVWDAFFAVKTFRLGQEIYATLEKK